MCRFRLLSESVSRDRSHVDSPSSRSDTPTSLAQLLERVASEDAAALRALYDLTSSKLFGLALRILVKREWAEEVLQDAFVNIWRYAGDYRAGLSAPMTWMASIVRNRALDYLRRQKANGASAETQWSEALDDILPGNEADPSEQTLMSQEARQLRICMEQLEASQRQAVALAYLRDQSHSEVADVMKVPLGTVKSWIRRGLEKLRGLSGRSVMDLHRHAGLVDQLAAEYTLGVMRGRSRRRFETIAQGDPAIRVAIETWRGRVEAIGELAPQEAPPPSVWAAIERRLNLGGARREAVVAPAARGRAGSRTCRSGAAGRSRRRRWPRSRSSSRCGSSRRRPCLRRKSRRNRTSATSPTLADKDAHPAMLVTWDDRTSEVTVRRLCGASDPTDKSMQLWGLPKEGHPVSLGVLPAGGTARFKAASVNAFPALAVSVEPLGGSPNPNGPTGPVVYTGKVIPARLMRASRRRRSAPGRRASSFQESSDVKIADSPASRRPLSLIARIHITMTSQLHKKGEAWSARFSEPMSELVKRYTSSVFFDKRLALVDIEGSLAHASMLAAQKIIGADDLAAIQRGMAQIKGEIERGEFEWQARSGRRAPEHRSAPDGADRRRRQAPAHRPLAQRPGRDRHPPVAARRDRPDRRSAEGSAHAR